LLRDFVQIPFDGLVNIIHVSGLNHKIRHTFKLEHVSHRLITGHDNDRNLPEIFKSPEAAHEGQTIHGRHFDVQKNQIRNFVFGFFETFFPVICRPNLISPPLKLHLQAIQNILVIING